MKMLHDFYDIQSGKTSYGCSSKTSSKTYNVKHRNMVTNSVPLEKPVIQFQDAFLVYIGKLPTHSPSVYN